MPRLARIAPALIGLALAAPATARAQSQSHSPENCAYCNPALSPSPTVLDRRGLVARMMGEDGVVIPAGHHVDHPGGGPAGPVAAWTDTSGALPPASAWYGGHDADAGRAIVGPGYDPAPAPFGGYGPTAMNEPMPIGEMRTSFVPPSAAAPAGPAFGASPAAPAMMPDPAIQAWHQMGMGDDSAPSRPGALSRMLGLSTVNNWIEGRRTMRAMRYASKHGMYSPSMSQMPGWAVTGR